MASVQFKKMNWYQKRPLHKVMDAWREKRREQIAEFQSGSQLMVNNLATAQYNLIEGKAKLAAEASLVRTEAELKAFAKNLTVNKFA